MEAAAATCFLSSAREPQIQPQKPRVSIKIESPSTVLLPLVAPLRPLAGQQVAVRSSNRWPFVSLGTWGRARKVVLARLSLIGSIRSIIRLCGPTPAAADLLRRCPLELVGGRRSERTKQVAPEGPLGAPQMAALKPI